MYLHAAQLGILAVAFDVDEGGGTRLVGEVAFVKRVIFLDKNHTHVGVIDNRENDRTEVNVFTGSQSGS